MSESVYDVLAYTSDMEASGLPRQQAEVIARGGLKVAQQQREDLLTVTEFKQAMLGIDARFARMEARFESIDARFEAIDARFEAIDARFEAIDARFEQIDSRFDQIDRHLGRHDQRMLVLDTLKVQSTLHSFMLGLIVLVLVVPQLQAWFAPTA